MIIFVFIVCLNIFNVFNLKLYKVFKKNVGKWVCYRLFYGLKWLGFIRFIDSMNFILF